jgi:hypothetical protein
VLIRVHAAGVTPTQFLWYPTTHRKSGETRSQAVPGHEFSGNVAGVGADVDAHLEVGQEVFCMNDWFADGATAEYCSKRASGMAPKPARRTHVEAASVPIIDYRTEAFEDMRASPPRGPRTRALGAPDVARHNHAPPRYSPLWWSSLATRPVQPV